MTAISKTGATLYPAWAWERMDNGEPYLNFYGQPIVDPGHFMERHRVVKHDTFAEPAVCACGWTRWESTSGLWYEMTDHLIDQSEHDLLTFGPVQ